MRIAACITTRNRTPELDACLSALWRSSVPPFSVIVSDDSLEPATRAKNQTIVEQYPGTTYLVGPRRGVCANRNNAVNAVTEAEFVAFVDDDICVEPEFIAIALAKYEQMQPAQRQHTIVSGITKTQHGQEIGPTKLSFRGYFCSTDTPEAVNIHAAVFPREFFQVEQWDENIFFGYEDAELCLRALKRQYHILFYPELKALHTCYEQGTLAVNTAHGLTNYQIHVESARLYVGVKRYAMLSPNPVKLVAFLGVYFTHMTLYLSKHRAINALPEILKRSHILAAFGKGSATTLPPIAPTAPH